MNSDADIAALEALLASMRVWILSIAAAFLDLIGDCPLRTFIKRELRTNLRAAERAAKKALFLIAVSRLDLTPAKQRRLHARRYTLKRRKCSELRRFTHGIFHARPTALRLRIDRLRDMLENSAAWIARLVVHLQRSRDAMHRILAAPPVARAYRFATPSLSPADSS
ncbi:MAG: hypothetical protein JNJ73_03150 [Hyphomonadaceae bacterium]|nr:hypothetical protein [Hyphomonadaceae bacterium]